ncbi:hypothetical protein BC940DRAFT_295349 [Gongronella butleri]|nr:hypothetical protein BC940DRAFT_295349 [Gongronella butleri]
MTNHHVLEGTSLEPKAAMTAAMDSNSNEGTTSMKLPRTAPDALLRLRESEATHLDQAQDHLQESLHSFSFASNLSTDLVALRQRVMTRSMDFMKHSLIGLPGDDSQRRSKTKSMGCSRPVVQLRASASVATTTTTARRRRSLPGGEFRMTPATPSPASTVDASSRPSSSSSSTSTANTSISPHEKAESPVPHAAPLHRALSDDESHQHLQQPTLALFPHPALHNVSRFMPHSQAILTTYDDWNIILSNNIAPIVFGADHNQPPTSMVGRSVLHYIDESFRTRLHEIIHTRRQELLDRSEDGMDGMVLVCGNVLPIVKEDGTKSAASLWLKEKRNETGSSVYIWIFEEVFETVTHVSIDAQGLICYIDRGVDTLLDYLPDALMGQSIETLIPSLGGKNEWQTINERKYFGCRTRQDAHFPIMAKLFDGASNVAVSRDDLQHQTLARSRYFTIRITSIPMMAGLVTVRQDGIIDGCNDAFVKYMFGYSQEELAGKRPIAHLLPQFPALFASLRRDDLLQHGMIINNIICRKLLADSTDESTNMGIGIGIANEDDDSSDDTIRPRRKLTHTPNGQALPVLLAIHRDGTSFEIQLQLKLVDESEQDGLCALWITFDRDAAFRRVGHKMEGPALELAQHDGLGLPTAKRLANLDEDEDDDRLTAHDHTSVQPSAPFGRSSLVSPRTNKSESCDAAQISPVSASASASATPCQSADALVTSPSASAAVAAALITPATAATAISTNATTTTTTTATNSTTSSTASSSPRVITTFSRPVFATSVTESPTSPLTPSSPSSVISYHRPRAFSSASSSIMGEYSAQTKTSCIDEYDILDEIGQGAYGMVKLAVKKDDGTKQKVVIKYVIKSRILVDCWTRDRKLGMVPAEIHILHTLRKIPHDNCGDMLDYFEDDDYYYIVMALHGAGMDLFDYIELKETMLESEIRAIFKQIALAVNHLHSHGIVHRDVKDENIVLDQNGRIRLIDFGSAAYVKRGRRYETFVGTLDYAAPEILKGHTYEGPPQDVWALGILLYTLIYRENPFYDIDEILERELRVPFVLTDGLSLDLINNMLERDVAKRWNIEQVLQHEWLKEP